MSDLTPPRLLSFSDGDRSPLSIRARALVFIDPRSRGVLQRLEQLISAQVPVLIEGESGSGKELLARHIHRESQRSGLFVAVNCGTLSPTWAQAELFGHTGRDAPQSAASRAGWFGSASGGTLYLDEIADLPRALQERLLHALENHEVTRVGAPQPTPVDVHLVAATSIDLSRAVKAGHFSQRLYDYLHEGHLCLPALRQRPADILPMAEYFLGVYSQRLKLNVPQISAAAQMALQNHSWPGNTRELENVIHFALLVCEYDTLQPEHLALPGSNSEKPCRLSV